MNHFIKDIAIQNFKSIQNIAIKDCSRINIFIGEPNVGKSNILEALGVVGLPYNHRQNPNYSHEFIRPHSKIDLFYNGDTSNPLLINSTDREYNKIEIKYNKDENIFLFDLLELQSFDNKKFVLNLSFNENKKDTGVAHRNFSLYFRVLKYNFSLNTIFENNQEYILSPSFGKNLPSFWQIIRFY